MKILNHTLLIVAATLLAVLPAACDEPGTSNRNNSIAGPEEVPVEVLTDPEKQAANEVLTEDGQDKETLKDTARKILKKVEAAKPDDTDLKKIAETLDSEEAKTLLEEDTVLIISEEGDLSVVAKDGTGAEVNTDDLVKVLSVAEEIGDEESTEAVSSLALVEEDKLDPDTPYSLSFLEKAKDGEVVEVAEYEFRTPAATAVINEVASHEKGGARLVLDTQNNPGTTTYAVSVANEDGTKAGWIDFATGTFTTEESWSPMDTSKKIISASVSLSGGYELHAQLPDSGDYVFQVVSRNADGLISTPSDESWYTPGIDANDGKAVETLVADDDPEQTDKTVEELAEEEKKVRSEYADLRKKAKDDPGKLADFKKKRRQWVKLMALKRAKSRARLKAAKQALMATIQEKAADKSRKVKDRFKARRSDKVFASKAEKQQWLKEERARKKQRLAAIKENKKFQKELVRQTARKTKARLKAEAAADARLAKAVKRADKKLAATLQKADRQRSAALNKADKQLNKALKKSEKQRIAAVKKADRQLNKALKKADKKLATARRSADKTLKKAKAKAAKDPGFDLAAARDKAKADKQAAAHQARAERQAARNTAKEAKQAARQTESLARRSATNTAKQARQVARQEHATTTGTAKKLARSEKRAARKIAAVEKAAAHKLTAAAH